MNQHETPVGTLAYLGHPGNHRLIQKRDDGQWYVVNPMPVMSVEADEFRAGWHPLAIEGQSSTGPHSTDPTWWVITGNVASGHDFNTGDVVRRATYEEQFDNGCGSDYPDWFIKADGEGRPWAVAPADRRPLQAGDPDNLSGLAHNNYCYEADPSGTGWVCTWAADHTGDHMAGDENEVLAVWPE